MLDNHPPTRVSRRTTLRWIVSGTLAAAVPSVLLACDRPRILQSPAVTAAPLTAIRFASNRTLAEVGVYIASERGYFAEQGLEVSVAQVTGMTLSAALATGQVDAAGSPVNASLFNTMASGIDVRIVAPMARQDPGASSTYLMVRKDLIDSGRFASYGDLRGKRIGVAGTPNYILARTLQHAGLEPESVEPVDLGTDFQAMTAALTTGAIDAASQPEPTATLTTHAGAGVKWREVSDVAPGLQLTVVLFGPGLRTRPDIAQRWMAAYLRGVRDYHDAFIKNGPGRDDIIDILARSTPVTDPLLYRDMGFPYIDPNGQPNQDSLSDQLQFAQAQGLLTGALDIQDVLDTQYAEAAVEHLGRYQA